MTKQTVNLTVGKEVAVKPQPARKAGAVPAKPHLPRRAKREPLKPEVRTPAVTGEAQDLFAPHESAALLGGFEHDHPVHAPQAGDDLWERLARTGWLSKRTGEVRRDSPAAQRPSA